MTAPEGLAAAFGGEHHTLEGPSMRARVTSHGARLVSLEVADRRGLPVDVVLGYGSLADYRSDVSYHGAIVGRFANRIGGGCFTLGGRRHVLSRNDGDNTLHGGRRGLDAREWTVLDSGVRRLRLGIVSPDGDEGFPGTLAVEVLYSLDDAAFRIDLAARSDAPTVVNLTSHAYFNLAGERAGDILDHEITVDANAFTPVDGTLIPTGEVRDVSGTAFDLRTPAVLGDQLARNDPQLVLAGGFDHNFVLRGGVTAAPRSVARLACPRSGIEMAVLTTEPGLQLYTGQQLDRSRVGKGGVAYGPHAGLCLETQHFPDSPNRPQFPSTRLLPGETYRSTTIWRFAAA
jgi:aldose 1-epimerase